ncbi:sensor histidine kinase [Mucilaginibacter sp. Mucisp86]|uniref:sensor histidine kinase n=1 Tax=Mucilaginibacter sp. Mucisp86 TaxID=3243060 RepID=UPI0039B6E666
MNLLDRLLEFHRKHRWPSHVAYWTAVLLVDVSSSKYSDGAKGSYGFEFLSDFLYELTYMIAAYTVAYVIIPKLFERKKYVWSVLAFIGISYLTSALGRIIIVKVCEPLAGVPPKAFETYKEILTDIPKLIYVYFFQIMAGAFVFVCFKLFKDQIEVKQHALELEKGRTEAELKLLKTQLHPHFLFNTLNNIYSLSLTGSPVAPVSIARLADILDHILYRCNNPLVPLSAEIELINNYIGLEKLRYDERLTIDFHTHIENEVYIAPLILLSLVENAFKHGAGHDAGAPTIHIRLLVNRDALQFNITNSIAGAAEKQLKGERIGLSNLRRQLDLIYGDEYRLVVTPEEKQFMVTLDIPLNQQYA